MNDSRDDVLLRTLVALEGAAWKALSQGTGAEFYREHLTEDAVMVFAFGILSRAETIAAMEAAPPWSTYRIAQPMAVRLTDGSAVLTYRATAQRAGQEPYDAFMSTLFVERDGSWMTAFHQQTPRST